MAVIISVFTGLFSRLPMSCSAVNPLDDSLYVQKTEPGVAYYNAIKAARTNDADGESFLHPYAWTSSAMVVTTLFVFSILVSIYTITREVRKKWVVTALILVSFLSGIFGVVVYLTGTQTLIEAPWKIFYGITRTVPKPPITMVMDWLLWSNTLLLTFALCALSSPFGSREDSLGILIRRKQLTTSLLYLSALTLSVAVIQVNLLYRMPGNAGTLGLTVPQYNSIAAGVTIITGSSFTVLLAAAFLPVLFVLRFEAHAIAIQKGNVSTEAELHEWLKKNGFDSSWQQQLSRIAAIIGPFIAGWVGEPLMKSF